MENGFVSKLLAIKQAAQIGCFGAHQNSHGEWIPCSSIKQYLAITQPQSVKSRMTLDAMNERSKRRKKKGRKRRDGWEKLSERRVFGVESLNNGGLVSPRNSANLVNGGSIPPMTYGASTSSGVSTKGLGQTIGSEQGGSSSSQQRDGDGDGYVASTPGGPDDTRVSAKNTNQSKNNNKKPPKGQVVKGNINLNNRPIVKNKDGSISTVRSISMTEGKLTVLIPTVIRNQDGTGKIVSNQEAWRHYKKTGEHLGKFSSIKDADAYAVILSKEQAAQYLPQVRTSPSRISAKSAQVAYSPRDNDDDVFIDIESARRRAQQIGCIGISRRISKSGKIVWMPCTNLTDYNNLTGMTALGRHNQEKRTQKVVRTILSNELKKRKKSLVEEIIGKAIGPKISGVSRFSARTLTQRFDPKAEDGDGDGMLQDGSAFQRPALPGVPKPQDAEKPMSSISLASVGKWFDTTTPKQREKLTGTPIENFGASTRSTRGFSSVSKPIKPEPIKIDGLENPDASETNPFRNLGGRKMGEIIRGLVKPSSKNKKQRTTYLVGGTTGGGKSTVLDEHLVVQGIVPGRTEAAHVDPDFIKLGLTGYNDGAGAPMVHEESLRSAQRTMDDARKEGMDLVATGAGSTRQRAIIAQARQNGDRVVAHWVHVPAEEASKRIQERQKIDGRKIPDQTSHFARSIPRMVSDAVSNGEVDEFYIWDNNVEQGKPPRLVASFKDGKFDVLDQEKLDEFMNGNKLSPKVREGNVLSDGEREALKESDEFMGNASSSKNKKGGRYTPPKAKPTTTLPSSVSPSTRTNASLKNDSTALLTTKLQLRLFAQKITDYLTKDAQGNPRNISAFLTEKLTARMRATTYMPNAPDGTPISIGKLSLKVKLLTPEDVDKVLDIYVPIKDPNETMEQFAARIIKTLPHMEFARVSSMNPSEKYLADLLKKAGYRDDLQMSLRDVLKEEILNNESFRNLIQEFGMPFYVGGKNDLTGSSLEDNGTAGLHSPGLGMVLISEKTLIDGKFEAVGSTSENKKENTVQTTLRHEWFHYLDGITLAADDQARDKRLKDYLSGLNDLLGDPEKRIKKIYPNEKSVLEDVERILIENLAQTIMQQNSGMSEKEALKQARQAVSMRLQDRAGKDLIINGIVPDLLDSIFSPNLIQALIDDRGGVSDDEAKKYSAYARYGIHELIAEIGRMITSTASERGASGSDVVKIDSSTIDILVNYMPSISRAVWVSVIKSAFPGIQIKQLRGN